VYCATPPPKPSPQMTWIKQHSQNAVAKRARLRIERANAELDFSPVKIKSPGKLVPDFTINIRSRSGERVQITATKWGKQFITGDGVKSARSISRGIEAMLLYCNP
jgi:hypothetical protein